MPGVRVFVLDDRKRVLMVKSNYEKRSSADEFWVIPGGGVEPGELTRDAGIREVLEETGLEIEISRLLWVVEEILPNGEMNYCNYFLGNIIGGSLKKGFDPELSEKDQVIVDVAFLSKDELDKLPRVYPEVLRDEFWKIVEDNSLLNETWRVRPTRGFGYV
jgi:8-oxo-dGTP diphosphatase